MKRAAAYVSSDSSESESEEMVSVLKKTRRKLVWEQFATYSNDQEAKVVIASEDTWSVYNTNNSSDGKKVYYRCNKVKLRGTQCNAILQVFYPNDSDEVILYKTKSPHNHDELGLSKHGISKEAKLKIKEMHKLHLKPKAIMEVLKANNMIIQRRQLSNYLHQLNENEGKMTISMGELEEWCLKNQKTPDSDDEAFVCSHEVQYEDEIDDDENMEENGNKFRFFLTTKRLLSIAIKSNKIHADATYKLIWQGFPVLIVGTTDLDRKFHPICLSVCTEEKQKDFEFIFKAIRDGLFKLDNSNTYQPEVLIADGSDAIRNAFRFSCIFGSNKMVMCWAHVCRRIDNNLCLIKDKNERHEVMSDIEKLQICDSTNSFQLTSELFLKKYEKHQDFINYFQSEWLTAHSGWYEGHSEYTPSTNNALEATNKVIKQENTLRERFVLFRFLVVAIEMVRKWSRDRDENQSNAILFVNEPTITLSKWTKSYQFAESPKTILEYTSKATDETNYYAPAGAVEKLTKTQLNKYNKRKWNNFDDYKESLNIWKVILPNNPSLWRKGSCHCPAFFKEFICKHVIGLAIRLKYCKPPRAAKDIKIGEKKKTWSS
jgi:hypothetical protein